MTRVAELAERLERIERLLVISAKEALDTREEALFLGLSESRVRHLVHGRLIPHYKKGANVFFRKSELEGWMLRDHGGDRAGGLLLRSKALTNYRYVG